jgi:hypothetical protein
LQILSSSIECVILLRDHLYHQHLVILIGCKIAKLKVGDIYSNVAIFFNIKIYFNNSIKFYKFKNK